VNCAILFAGVGGQGVLSVAALIASSALQQGYSVKQSEVHGMAQRGGAVQAHLRFADHEVHSDLIPRAGADMILGMEPLESLRYLDYLSAQGILLTANRPVKNIPDYPDIDDVLKRIRSLPKAIVIDTEGFAKRAGSTKTANVVMVGAASRFLPLEATIIKDRIAGRFAHKGEKILKANLKAFELGRNAVQ